MSAISSLGQSASWAAASRPTPSPRMKEDMLNRMDSDSSGGVSQSELDTAFAPPADTQGFVQSRGGMPPPPPMGGAGDSEATTDPLDTNGDGVVSAEELATQLQAAATAYNAHATEDLCSAGTLDLQV